MPKKAVAAAWMVEVASITVVAEVVVEADPSVSKWLPVLPVEVDVLA